MARYMQNGFVKMQNISKSFGANIALSNVSLKIEKGKVTALLGENGAGKTTLMNILSGLYQPDSGKIEIENEEVVFRSPSDALRHGIVAVHQHFQLIDNFSVYENVVLGTKAREESARKIIQQIIADYGFDVPLDVKVKKLQVGEQQKVEIIKAIFRRPSLLILDEPTTNLTPQEIDLLFTAVKRLVKGGLAIVFITHKIKEVMQVADRIAILRGGQAVGSFEKEEVNEDEVIRMMIGDKTVEPLKVESWKISEDPSNILVKLEDVSVTDRKNVHLLRKVSLILCEGEIVGIAGISGNGQKELIELIAGVRKPSSGKMSIMGKDASTLDASQLIQLGVRYIPEDRIYDGILPSMSIAENITLGHHKREPFAKAGLLDNETMRAKAAVLVDTFQIKADTITSPAWKLSGGNIQKLLLARSMLVQPRVVLAHNPTRGLDIRSTNFVLNKFIDLKREGCGILFVSEDLDELMTVSDRIVVISKGEITGNFDRNNFDRYEIGKKMLANVADDHSTRNRENSELG
ncbi:MAG: ABC transporter ATP-binding protein [Conexivisphaerales archaeon]